MATKTKYWFKAKNYGWGWYPASWQGWSILLFYLYLVVSNFRQVDAQSHSVSDTMISILPEFFILTILLIIICHATGEKPEWRWGEKKSAKRR